MNYLKTKILFFLITDLFVAAAVVMTSLLHLLPAIKRLDSFYNSGTDQSGVIPEFQPESVWVYTSLFIVSTYFFIEIYLFTCLFDGWFKARIFKLNIWTRFRIAILILLIALFSLYVVFIKPFEIESYTMSVPVISYYSLGIHNINSLTKSLQFHQRQHSEQSPQAHGCIQL